MEERHYIGHKYRPQLMGNWNPVLKKPAAGPPIMLQLKPATWYQVRIAAVSKNGSSGFSNPSQPFKSAVGQSRVCNNYNNISVNPLIVKMIIKVSFFFLQPQSLQMLRII